MLYQKIKLLLSIFLLVFVTTSCASNLDIQTLNKKANTLMNAGDVDGAIAKLEAIKDLNPNVPQTNYNLGIAYYKKGNLGKALTALNKAILLNKNFADAYYSRAVIYEDLESQGTIDAGKKFDKANPENTDKKLEYLYKAREDYTKYVNIAKDASDAQGAKSKIEELNSEISKYKPLQQPQSIPAQNKNN